MIATRSFTLEAGASLPITLRGNFIRVLESDTTLRLSTTPIVGNGSTFDVAAGLSFQTREFSSFRVENIGGESSEIKLVISDEGFVNDDRLSAKAVVNFNNTATSYSILTGQVFATAGITKEVAPENPSRKELTFEITGECTIGTSAGPRLPAGIYTWNNTSALTLRSNENDVTCRLLEESL